jgi:hypothetical protein
MEDFIPHNNLILKLVVLGRQEDVEELEGRKPMERLPHIGTTTSRQCHTIFTCMRMSMIFLLWS